MPHIQRQVAQALSCAALPGASNTSASPGALASFSMSDFSGPKISAALLQLRTQARPRHFSPFIFWRV